ncbi:hypothetical protein CEV08_00105 [Bartonella tribocorum]|uniref:Uncharacterized protein n=1 Tax=Bartonella tribocorum TaxID=85701 RepID=A0A2M6UXT0_9HYPH|nr:hypothetical protein CEV08_00105 [Bartonella tribocorum]
MLEILLKTVKPNLREIAKLEGPLKPHTLLKLGCFPVSENTPTKRRLPLFDIQKLIQFTEQ